MVVSRFEEPPIEANSEQCRGCSRTIVLIIEHMFAYLCYQWSDERRCPVRHQCLRPVPAPAPTVVVMADRSSIEWTEATWNPTTGCDRVSTGCDSCYAQTLAKRLKAMGQPKYQNDGDPRTSGPGFALTVHADSLGIPIRWREPRTVFVNSMSDLFHDSVPLDFIREVLDVVARCPQHTFQVLTKRSRRLASVASKLAWPPNLWMGVSVESDRYCFRVDHLREVPAAVRFVSAEPLLGQLTSINLDEIHWLIAGGESGPRSRPMDIEWVRHLREACAAAAVPFFFKQWGGRTPKAGGRLLDGRTWDDMPETINA